MATLNLNTDDADRALAILAKGYEVFSTAQKTVLGQINSALRDSDNWVSSSADEFYSEYDELDGNLLLQIEQLTLLQQQLKNEIDQWKRADKFTTSYYPS